MEKKGANSHKEKQKGLCEYFFFIGRQFIPLPRSQELIALIASRMPKANNGWQVIIILYFQ